MEYKKQEYDEIIEKIENIISSYEANKFRDNTYQLFLANGDIIKYNFNENNIPHLLGIDFSTLISRHIMEKTDSYKMLCKLVSDPYKYWSEIIKHSLSITDIFSKYTLDKINNFEYQIRIPYPNQIYFVCKYNRERNYTSKLIDGLYADYFIARKNEDGDILLLGLAKQYENSLDNNYIPQTSRIIRNDENFMENLDALLKNQIITYETGLIVNNKMTSFNKNYNLSIIEINDVLQLLENLSRVTDAIPSTLQGHIYNLTIFSKNRNNSYDTKNLLSTISDLIKMNSIVELSEGEKSLLDNSILSIIDSHNDSLFSKNEISSSSMETFTKLRSERDYYQKELSEKMECLQQLKKELLETQELLEKKDEQIEELSNKTQEYEVLKKQVLSLASSIQK